MRQLRDLCSELVTVAEAKSLKLLQISRDASGFVVDFELYRSEDISLELTIRLLYRPNRPLDVEYFFSIFWPRAQELQKMLSALDDTSDLPPEALAVRNRDYPVAMLIVGEDRRVSQYMSSAVLSSKTKGEIVRQLTTVLDFAVSQIIPEFSPYCSPNAFAEKAVSSPSISRLWVSDLMVPAILTAAGHGQLFLEWRESFKKGTFVQRDLAAERRTIRYLDSLQKLLVH